LETLVHSENVRRLEVSYRVFGLSTRDHLDETQISEVMNTYMLMYVLELDHDNITKEDVDDGFENIKAEYPTWPDTLNFVKEVRQLVIDEVGSSERYAWSTTLKVLEEVGERYGRWQDKECRTLKRALVDLEDDGSGRVRLERFYSSALNNNSFQFFESVPYLRMLGALDETDGKNKKVIIPNYVNSPSNCVASSKFYSVCCIDECDSLVATLEAKLESADASPDRIVELISNLASETVQAPRTLDTMLVVRLEEIAARHGGLVPVHGRLFAQWLHHAYPRECPYPHLSGTTNRLTIDAFVEHTGQEGEASEEEILDMMRWATANHAANSTAAHTKDTAASPRADLPWSVEEELFVCRPHFAKPQANFDIFGSPQGSRSSFGGCKFVFFLLLLALLLWRLQDIVFAKSCVSVVGSAAEHKYYV